MGKNKKATRGFTLIEVIVTAALYVIVILAVMGTLLPAYQLGSRYSDKDKNNTYLLYLEGVLTDKIQHAQGIKVLSGSSPLLDHVLEYEFITPDSDGYYDINNDLFAQRTADGDYIRAPIKPKKNTNLRVHMEKIGVNSVVVSLSLEQNGREVSETEFIVKAQDAGINVDFTEAPTEKGKQSIQFNLLVDEVGGI